MSVTVHEEFLEALKETARQVTNGLATGSIESYSDYKDMCGFIRGLNESFNIYEEVIKKISLEQEDE